MFREVAAQVGVPGEFLRQSSLLCWQRVHLPFVLGSVLDGSKFPSRTEVLTDLSNILFLGHNLELHAKHLPLFTLAGYGFSVAPFGGEGRNHSAADAAVFHVLA